ncbi:MAG: hypothetical protein DIJKHBIC_04809 [Thermoanaerobaculia bacterium]|nr:hypothetical protein [Thermoanaerobaculia bacterium]
MWVSDGPDRFRIQETKASPTLDATAASFKLTLVDGQQQVVPESEFLVHVCPRFDHESAVAPRPCEQAPTRSTNGIIETVSTLPGWGYLGVELTKAPLAPDTYYVKVESIGQTHRIRIAADRWDEAGGVGNEFVGNFKVCTIAGLEILDTSYSRLPDGLYLAEPKTVIVRYVGAASQGAGASITATLETRRASGPVVSEPQNVLLGRLGLSDVYIGTAIVGPTVYGAPEKQGPRPNNTQLLSAPGFGILRASVGSLLEDKKTKCPVPATIASVGFKNDFTITRWDDDTKVDEPDGCTPTWSRGASQEQNDKSPVAYVKGTLPRAFGLLAINPPMPDAVTVSLRLLWNGQISAFKRGMPITGGSAETMDIDFLIPLAHDVEETNPTFQWEMSYDERTWWPVGASGPHKMYWTYRAPLIPPFANRYIGEGFPQIYDKALEKATEAAVNSAPGQDLGQAFNSAIASQVPYNAGFSLSGAHPLEGYSAPEGVQCDDHADLLTGLLRTMGLEAQTEYVWNGTLTSRYSFSYANEFSFMTFQASRPSISGICENPHFTYHALVTMPPSGRLLDPSYGLVENELIFLESVEITPPHSLRPGNATQVRSRAYVEATVTTTTRCTHAICNSERRHE